MLTVDYDRLGVRPGDRLLDLGCGAGRHAFEAHRRGAQVVACDRSGEEVAGARTVLEAMTTKGEAPAGALGAAVGGDALALPFADGAFDRVIAAEVLEHIDDDGGALRELARVLRPGGTMAVTVPAWLPERLCWALSRQYHSIPGGHLRIYRRAELGQRLREAGLAETGAGHAHALHAPYWWVRCAVGVGNESHLLARAYHRFLVWDMTAAWPAVRLVEKALNPLIGKSLVLYASKPTEVARGALRVAA
ncbi:MAG: class I SAM-dependent methyltransferase [Acidimicrobiales bacterium]